MTHIKQFVTLFPDSKKFLQPWNPTALEMMQALLFVLCEEPVKSDALFVHGSQGDRLLDEKELDAAAKFYFAGLASKIVINGVSVYDSRKINMAYIGYEAWLAYLLKCGVDQKDILLISASMHTAEEAKNLLILAEQMSWETLTIMSVPHHQLRAFLTFIALIKELKSPISVYNQTFAVARGDWARNMMKLALGGKTASGHSNVIGPMDVQIAMEFERVVKYAQYWEPDDASYTRHATIPEMFEYLKSRRG